MNSHCIMHNTIGHKIYNKVQIITFYAVSSKKNKTWKKKCSNKRANIECCAELWKDIELEETNHVWISV